MRKPLKVFGIGLAVLFILAIILFYFFYNPSDHHMFPKCPFYSVTDLYCPGCGSQRAIHHILNGNILIGLKHNLLIVLLGSILTYDAIIWIVNKTLKKDFKNILHKTTTTYSILILVILFWVFRNIDLYPFSILAP